MWFYECVPRGGTKLRGGKEWQRDQGGKSGDSLKKESVKNASGIPAWSKKYRTGRPGREKKGGRAGARFATDPRARVRACVRVISRTDRRTDERYASHGHAMNNPGTDVREGPLVICFSCNTGNYFDRSHERGAAGNNALCSQKRY